jgi:perosamine synthetase
MTNSKSFMLEVEAFLERLPNPYKATELIMEFENALAKFYNVKEAIAVSTGTAAIHCALAALNIGEGDEVIVPSASLIMSVVPILYQNATPVFVDCQPNSIDFDYADLERKMTPKVKAIIPVYLWGCSYNMSRLTEFTRKHNVAIIEDACQAHGSQWDDKYLGTWGEFGCFSMKDGKLLSTGEGGFILTNNSDMAKKCRLLRSHWTDIINPEHSYSQLAWNYRLTEFQALLGKWQQRSFSEKLEKRRAQVTYLYEKLSSAQYIERYQYSDIENSNYFNAVFLLKDKKNGVQISKELAKMGILNSVGSFGLQPVQQRNVFRKVVNEIQNNYSEDFIKMPNAANFLERVLALIILPEYSKEYLDDISQKLKYVLSKYSG